MTALTLAPPLPAPTQPGQITVVAEQGPAAEVMYAKLWRTPIEQTCVLDAHRADLADAHDRAASAATALYATAEPTRRAAALGELAGAYRQIAVVLPRRHWQKRVLTGRAVLAEVLATCEPRPAGVVLDPIPAQADRVAEQQAWAALAATTDRVERAELLQGLYDRALAAGVSGWTASILLALATTETAVASHPA
jgi:hypothetical protein